MDLNHTKHKYLPSVDGLRSIAVFSVVVFHFFPKYLKGGYVGVDIFFLISGYLVTGNILKSIENNSFDFIQFYKKRILRLLPALLVVITTCLLFSFFFLFSEELKRLGLHLFSGTFFFSNILYSTEVGYFDKTSELKPFLHLWSLSLEEQFYFIWPLVLVLFTSNSFFKSKTNLKTLIALISLISFVLCGIYTKNNQSVTFFNLPFRLWELSLGGLVAVLQIQKKIDEVKYEFFFKALSYIGFILIVFSMITYSSKTIFPGYAAIIPILGTFLILISKNEEVGIKRILKASAPCLPWKNKLPTLPLALANFFFLIYFKWRVSQMVLSTYLDGDFYRISNPYL